MKMRISSLAMASVLSASIAYAGFFDGVKKIGGGLAEAAGSAFDSAVNVTTGAVQLVSTDHGETNAASAMKKKDVGQVPSQDDSVGKDTRPMTVQQPSQHEREQTRRKRAEEERERRYQAEQERQRKGREQWAQENREKAERERAEREKLDHEREERAKAERERVEAERTAQEKARREQEEKERVEREKEEAERLAKEKAERDKIAAEKAAIEKAKSDAVAQAHAVVANEHAKVAGSSEGYEFKPISIFRNIKLGMTIEEVYNVLEPESKALDVNMSLLKDVLYVNRSMGYGDDEYVGTDYDKWVGGRGCKIPLKSHILVLRFAYVAGYGEDKQRVLISAELKFRSKDNAPEPSAVCEKYAQIPGVKVSKEKEKYGDRFRDGTSQFWKVIYWNVCKEIKYQKDCCQEGMVDSGDETYKAIMAKLEADEKAIRTDIVEDVFREVDVFEADGMQIRVKPDMETKKASIVTFEDVVMSKWLEKFKAGIDAQKKKAAADAKAAAEKKATAAALEF